MNLASATPFALILASAIAAPRVMADGPSKAIPVKVEKTEAGYRMTRGGEPYFIKGAGGRSYLEVLKETGGNAIRTWGEEEIGPLLDRAHELGITVTVGIWLGPAPPGVPVRQRGRRPRRDREVPADLPPLQGPPRRPDVGPGNEMEDDGNDPRI